MKKLLLFIMLIIPITVFAGTLEDDLIQFKPNPDQGPFGRIMVNNALKSELKSLEDIDPSLKLIFLARPGVDLLGNYYNDIINYCNKLGMYTTEDVQFTADSIDDNIAEKLISVLRPTVVLPPMQIISHYDLYDIVATEFDDILINHMTDSEYNILTPEALVSINENIDASAFEYISQNRDCDDFVRIWRGFMSQIGYGNVTAAYCEMSFKSLKGTTYYHAVVMLLIDDGSGLKWAIYDPQLAPGTLTWLNGQTKYTDLQIRNLFW